MRQFGLVAVGALRERGLLKGVVSAAFLGARIGVSTFWIRHGASLFFVSMISILLTSA